MNWPERLIQILTLKCEGTSVRLSREQDEPLGLTERLAVRGHLLVCRSCRRFRRQLQFLRLALHRRDGERDESGPEQHSLSPEARARIERVIAETPRENLRDEDGD
jgi:hypothetical protein